MQTIKFEQICNMFRFEQNSKFDILFKCEQIQNLKK
jgi:hypothetical protein